ncbi:unnamed protein product [Kuraishia capsulata CBS 1993]|uniref:aminodeoxychorismate synthase n=1 Tax=Kuraishia capsulata CBS 1993 TaxID=1382522 RepID=W6MI27_9ASCO|nr:uncharacterized protein KUCA_T00001731001 [Kuraishia capsulata CBS 1993]CDK25761.1 unnamed protein product [Kuraishia capsulata CBS 1993]
MPILLVDSYDSFTFNLKNLIENATAQSVFIIHNDSFSLPDQQMELDQLLDSCDAIVVGPGPGNPEDPRDIGIIPYLLTKEIPLLGICLGFQCLCLMGGLEMGYLKNPVHGQISSIKLEENTEGLSLFADIDSNFGSVRYHSIFVKGSTDAIVPLAYAIDEGEGKLLMAAKHAILPFYGVQYHPESICSTYGTQLVKNFWKIAQTINKSRSIPNFNVSLDPHIVVAPALLETTTREKKKLLFESLNSGFSTLDLCDNLKKLGNDFLLMNSAMTPGDWTIIGIPIPGESDVISHSTENINIVSMSKWLSPESSKITLKTGQTIWSYVASYMSHKFADSLPTAELIDSCPFHGGLIGIFSYEEGEFITHEKLLPRTNGEIPDTRLCFIDRFIARHVASGDSFIVSRRENDHEWLSSTKLKLETAKPMKLPIAQSISELCAHSDIKITRTDKPNYCKSFSECQRYLKEGHSYELCLTTQTEIYLPKEIDSWEMYKVLAYKNPSPYSCFMNFGDCQLLSSSPERFLRWDDTKAQLRPIKGTVAKSAEMTFEKAKQTLSTPKEFAENLMIVDLIRHDMYNFVPRVEVTKLMEVEEYSTVYQLVSVIEGYFGDHHTGIDVLSRSLPPGSMTGAPKKRSVEILQRLEGDERRGLYSGVCGYWSVNNNSDWSVIIRSMFNYKNDLKAIDGYSVWRIGAGGAITVLSSCEGEWDEMNVKLNSALQAFI